MDPSGRQGPVTGKLAWLSGVSAVLAFLACNGTTLLVGLLSFVGITLAINPHVQAATISIFAVVTLVFVYFGYRDHRKAGPLIISVVGAALVVGTLYTVFNKVVETAGLVLLIGSSIWSWRESTRRKS